MFVFLSFCFYLSIVIAFLASDFYFEHVFELVVVYTDFYFLQYLVYDFIINK